VLVTDFMLAMGDSNLRRLPQGGPKSSGVKGGGCIWHLRASPLIFPTR